MTATARPWHHDPTLAGLDGAEGLEEVEALLLKLAVGDRLDRLGAICQEHLGTGGKRLRARLALAAAEALGETRERVVPFAAAVELLHNATLVHDDLQDGDTVRRGHPTLWARHGAAQAINAGDLLLMLPVRAVGLLDAPGETKFRLAHRLMADAEATVRGQARELDLLGQEALTRHDWGLAAAGKSGALFGLPVAGAAILAGLDDRTAQRLGAAFASLGVLYQAWDDWIDLWGDKGRGAVGNDLREGKVSAVVVEHVERCPSDRGWLLGLLRAGRANVSDDQVRGAIRRFEEAGTHLAVKARIDALEVEVLDDPVLRALPDVHALARVLVDRFRR